MKTLENDKKKINYLSERSDQVKEILGKAPNWMIRWGITLIFIIVLLLILGSSLISYDDIVTARVTVSTKTPPAYIKANSTGKLTRLLVKTDESVVEGQILAEIENLANLEDVYWLKNKLSSLTLDIISLDSVSLIYPLNLKLGDIQGAYSNFVSKYQNYVLFNTLEPNKKEITTASHQIKEQYRLLEKQQNRLELFAQELELSKSKFERNKNLLDKSVISKAEFETITRSYLSDKQNYENFKSSISNTRISIATLIGGKAQSTITDKELTYNYIQEFQASLEYLKNDLSNWELKYIMKSPMDGKLTMFDIRSKFQNVNVGDIVFTIVPMTRDSLVGYLTMPVLNSGKVRVGQDVIIKLDNFPYQEWGSLMGEIVDISAVPKKGEALYFINVSINSLRTSFDKKLEFRQEMQGNAEIITDKLSILERIFYQLNKTFSRN